jgi:hypothetical protein
MGQEIIKGIDKNVNARGKRELEVYTPSLEKL